MARSFLFRCPLTATAVQGVLEDEVEAEAGVRRYKPIECQACGRIHLINPITGKLMSKEAES